MSQSSFGARVLRSALTAASVVSGPLTRRPRNDRGVELDPQIHSLLQLQRALGRPELDQLGATRARVEFRRTGALFEETKEVMEAVEDRRIASGEEEISLRIYTPLGVTAPAPVLVYYHGGGFVVGDLDTHDRVARYFAQASRVVVVAVDYRLAPEHPFPAAALDAVAAYRWVRAHAEELGIDPHRIAVGGDSAGGNLAAVVCQQAQLRGDPLPAFQLLMYPATDLTRSAESHRIFADGFLLTQSVMDWFVANYLSEPARDERDPRGSPLVTNDLAGLPPACVAVAGFDPLRDEGEAYAHALMASGVPTSLRSYESLVHGFVSLAGVVHAAAFARADLAAELRVALTAAPDPSRAVPREAFAHEP